MKRLLCVIVCSFVLWPVAGEEWVAPVVSDIVATTGSWDGELLWAYPRGLPEVTIARIKVQPGVSSPMHKHPVINAGVLLSGNLTVYTDNNKVLRLKPGDSIVEVVDTWHYWKNEGSTVVDIIVFYAGIVGRSITVNK